MQTQIEKQIEMFGSTQQELDNFIIEYKTMNRDINALLLSLLSDVQEQMEPCNMLNQNINVIKYIIDKTSKRG
jgi:hypothetical protein